MSNDIKVRYSDSDLERFRVIIESKIEKAQQGGADQPATARESKPEGEEKPFDIVSPLDPL